MLKLTDCTKKACSEAIDTQSQSSAKPQLLQRSLRKYNFLAKKEQFQENRALPVKVLSAKAYLTKAHSESLPDLKNRLYGKLPHIFPEEDALKVHKWVVRLPRQKLYHRTLLTFL